jgi:hypothetical protein
MNWCRLRQKQFLIGSIRVSVCLALILFIKEVWYTKPGVSLYAGGRQSLQRYFGDDADYIYTTVYSDPDKLLWVPSRYLYGLFYKHTQLTTPDYLRYSPYNHAAIINELQTKLPDYVFTVSQNVIDGPASQILKEVITACPQAFERISNPQNKFSFSTYKVNKVLLAHDACLANLGERESHVDIALCP